MDIKDFIAGQWKTGYQYRYFSPMFIDEHEFHWTEAKLNQLLEQAALKLGELNALARIVPNVDIFIKMHVLKVAVLSSRIEGTKTHISEALLEQPVERVQQIVDKLKISPKATNELVADFVKLSILREVTGYQRNRVFIYQEYLDLFEK